MYSALGIVLYVMLRGVFDGDCGSSEVDERGKIDGGGGTVWIRDNGQWTMDNGHWINADNGGQWHAIRVTNKRLAVRVASK